MQRGAHSAASNARNDGFLRGLVFSTGLLLSVVLAGVACAQTGPGQAPPVLLDPGSNVPPADLEPIDIYVVEEKPDGTLVYSNGSSRTPDGTLIIPAKDSDPDDFKSISLVDDIKDANDIKAERDYRYFLISKGKDPDTLSKEEKEALEKEFSGLNQGQRDAITKATELKLRADYEKELKEEQAAAERQRAEAERKRTEDSRNAASLNLAALQLGNAIKEGVEESKADARKPAEKPIEKPAEPAGDLETISLVDDTGRNQQAEIDYRDFIKGLGKNPNTLTEAEAANLRRQALALDPASYQYLILLSRQGHRDLGPLLIALLRNQGLNVTPDGTLFDLDGDVDVGESAANQRIEFKGPLDDTTGLNSEERQEAYLRAYLGTLPEYILNSDPESYADAVATLYDESTPNVEALIAQGVVLLQEDQERRDKAGPVLSSDPVVAPPTNPVPEDPADVKVNEGGLILGSGVSTAMVDDADYARFHNFIWGYYGEDPKNLEEWRIAELRDLYFYDLPKDEIDALVEKGAALSGIGGKPKGDDESPINILTDFERKVSVARPLPGGNKRHGGYTPPPPPKTFVKIGQGTDLEPVQATPAPAAGEAASDNENNTGSGREPRQLTKAQYDKAFEQYIRENINVGKDPKDLTEDERAAFAKRFEDSLNRGSLTIAAWQLAEAITSGDDEVADKSPPKNTNTNNNDGDLETISLVDDLQQSREDAVIFRRFIKLTGKNPDTLTDEEQEALEKIFEGLSDSDKALLEQYETLPPSLKIAAEQLMKGRVLEAGSGVTEIKSGGAAATSGSSGSGALACQTCVTAFKKQCVKACGQKFPGTDRLKDYGACVNGCNKATPKTAGCEKQCTPVSQSGGAVKVGGGQTEPKTAELKDAGPKKPELKEADEDIDDGDDDDEDDEDDGPSGPKLDIQKDEGKNPLDILRDFDRKVSEARPAVPGGNKRHGGYVPPPPPKTFIKVGQGTDIETTGSRPADGGVPIGVSGGGLGTFEVNVDEAGRVTTKRPKNYEPVTYRDEDVEALRDFVYAYDPFNVDAFGTKEIEQRAEEEALAERLKKLNEEDFTTLSDDEKEELEMISLIDDLERKVSFAGEPGWDDRRDLTSEPKIIKVKLIQVRQMTGTPFVDSKVDHVQIAAGNAGQTTTTTVITPPATGTTTTNTNTNTNTGNNTGNNTGGDAGNNTGNNTGDNTGGDAGNNTGNNTGGDAGNNTGNDAGGDTGGDTGNNNVNNNPLPSIYANFQDRALALTLTSCGVTTVRSNSAQNTADTYVLDITDANGTVSVTLRLDANDQFISRATQRFTLGGINGLAATVTIDRIPTGGTREVRFEASQGGQSCEIRFNTV